MTEPKPLMRLPALHMLEAPITNASHIPGAEAEYHRDATAHAHAQQRQTRLACSPHAHGEVHKRVSALFSGSDVNAESEESGNASGSDDDHQSPGGGRFARRASVPSHFHPGVSSYSRLMYAHTKFQLSSPPSNTLPSYNKTMHAFTLNQLNTYRNLPTEPGVVLSAPSTSPTQTPLVPSRLHVQLGHLNLDVEPHAPSNTPEQDARVGQEEVSGIDFRKLKGKRRSITEPLPRDFVVAMKARDFAMS